MNRVIILEGPDGSGKTTLANHLVKLGFQYQHCGVPEEGVNLFTHYFLKLHRALLDGRDFVLDRLYLGETVYGPVMRGASRLTKVQRRLLHRYAQAEGVQEVICLPGYDACYQNWRLKESDYVDTTSRFNAIYDLYKDTLGDHGYDRYDYHGGALPVRSREPLPPGTIGSPKARFLFVGEQPNKRKAKRDLPFFADSASSGYLNEAIVAAGIREHDIALTNAVPLKYNVTTSGWRAASGWRDLNELVERLPNFQHAIALGIVAARACKQQGIPHVALPHPSYWKRFRSSESNQYTSMIGESCESSIKQYLQCVAPVAVGRNDQGKEVLTAR